MVGTSVLELTRAATLTEACVDKGRNASSVSTVINARLLVEAVRETSKKLFVVFSGQGDDAGKTDQEDLTRRYMPTLYNELWDAALETGQTGLDFVVLLGSTSLDAFLKSDAGSGVEVIFNAGIKIDKAAATSAPSSATGGAVAVRSLDEKLQEEAFGVSFVLYDNASDSLGQYRKVAVGGTFDHFHGGHKKLLAICISVCSEELTVGVTDDSMLGEKKLREYIEDVDIRKNHVQTYFSTLAPASLRANIVLIQDVWGPTVVDKDIEAIVVSTETLKGARLINEERAKRDMAPLKVIAVSRSNVYTLSSTFMRRLRADQTQASSSSSSSSSNI
ncbi:Phosphopantetheine adenylyltransferase [Hondaea fermentalgiana]|uniref:Phosphopantetheine adenylyltransferase n=1 Tax=Hondaea fermentalgiana TaxID=2315210 RepID=A0A2R5G9E9_9STRA|nr:Phosphopantetheine adenylyltransferase [Hondaea fermentalgiana]|eukprot:GBG25113.1 Phosphopantetheine adenylyltransferase [Hondaea fermentalgiana]